MANIQPHRFSPSPPNPIRNTTDAPAPAVPQRGILVVDDDALLLTLLNLALQKHGFTVWLASDGVKALEVYQRIAPRFRWYCSTCGCPGWMGRAPWRNCNASTRASYAAS